MLHLPATLHLDVTLHDEAASVVGVHERLVLAKRAGESLGHVLLKLLSWMLFYAPDLRIEVGVEQRHKPDLVRVDELGRPTFWIDCGSIGVKRLDRIARQNREAEVVVVKRTESEARAYLRSAEPFLRRPGRIRLVAFRAGFVDEIAAALHDHAAIVATVVGAPGHVYLDVAGVPLDSEVIVLRPSAT